MKTLNPVLILIVMFLVARYSKTDGKITKTVTIDSLGTRQKISKQGGFYLLYDDSRVGVMREYKLQQDSLIYQHKEYKFTVKRPKHH